MLERLFKRREDFSDVEVLFISKDDCHLCDDALEVVEGVRKKHPFALKIVKLEQGDDWYDLYWDKIPVVLIDGRMGFKYRVDAKELLAKLRGRNSE